MKVRPNPLTGLPEFVSEETKVFGRGGGVVGVGKVKSVVAGTNVTVDDTDPFNPVVSSTSGTTTEEIQDAVGGALADTSTLDLTYNDGANTITGDVLNSPLLGGQNSAYHLSRANHTGTQTASTISDFSEATDDRVSSLLTAGKAINLSYDDSGNALTVTGHTNQIIYNSSGSTGLLRFNTWSAVITYLALTGADTDIIIEQNETIPIGSYDLKRARFVGNNGLEYNAGGWTVTFGDNTTISAWETPSVRGCRLLSTSTTGNIFTSSSPYTVNCTAVSHVHSTSYPFFKFTGSGQCTVNVDNNARFQKLSGGVENIDVTSSAFACQLILYRGTGASVSNDIFKSTNAVIYVDVVGSGANDLTLYPTTNTNLVVGVSVPVNFIQATTTIHNPTTKSADFNFTRAAEVYLVDASGAARTGTLPAASGSGVMYICKKTDSSSNTVTIDGNASETIDGATTLVLSRQNDVVAIVDTGSGVWHVVADYRNQTIASGTYTPTRSAETNMDSNVTMSEAQYMRVGNTVTVSGRFTADPTLTATATDFEMSLPITSNLGAVEDLAGTAFCGEVAGQGAAIRGVVANDTAEVKWIAGDVTSQTWSYQFSYQVI